MRITNEEVLRSLKELSDRFSISDACCKNNIDRTPMGLAKMKKHLDKMVKVGILDKDQKTEMYKKAGTVKPTFLDKNLVTETKLEKQSNYLIFPKEIKKNILCLKNKKEVLNFLNDSGIDPLKYDVFTASELKKAKLRVSIED